MQTLFSAIAWSRVLLDVAQLYAGGLRVVQVLRCTE